MKNLQALRILAISALAAALVAPAASAQPAAAAYGLKPQVTIGVGGHVGGGVHAGIGVKFGQKSKKVGGHIGVGYGQHGPHVGYPKPYCAPKWVPGCWVTEAQRVWIPAKNVQVWVDPVYATKCDYFGNSYQVLVTPGHFKTVCEPGYWSSKRVRVWKAGHWA